MSSALIDSCYFKLPIPWSDPTFLFLKFLWVNRVFVAHVYSAVLDIRNWGFDHLVDLCHLIVRHNLTIEGVH